MARNPRAAAQRATARAVREHRTQLPASINRGVQLARRDYADRVMRGEEPDPQQGSLEARNLASLAGKARWGKADPAYETAFAKYWYHLRDESREEDEEYREDYEDDDSGEEGEE